MLDLILRNEDRLPCRQLGWRGNYANILFADKVVSANMDAPNPGLSHVHQAVMARQTGQIA